MAPNKQLFALLGEKRRSCNLHISKLKIHFFIKIYHNKNIGNSWGDANHERAFHWFSTIFKQQNSKNAEKFTVFQRSLCFNIRLTRKLCEWSPMMILGFDWSLILRLDVCCSFFFFLRKYFLVLLLYDPSREGKHPILYHVHLFLSLVTEKKILENSLCILLKMIEWSSTNSQTCDIWHLRVWHL